MANAFDEFDETTPTNALTKTEADPFAEFDQPTAPKAKRLSTLESIGEMTGVMARLGASMLPFSPTKEQPIAEAGITAASGLAGSVAGGLRGGASLLSGEGAEEAARKTRATQEALTIRPRSAAGEAVSRLAAYPLEAASALSGKAGGAIGQVVGGEQGRIAGESLGEVAPQLALAAAPLKGSIKAMRRPVETLPPSTPKEAQAQKAQELGYVLPPSEANPTLLNRLITGWGGKIQTEQAASIKNQPVTNSLAKKALGVAQDKTLSTDLLDAVRTNAGRSYQAIKESNVPIIANEKFKKSLNDLSQDWNQAEKDYPELVKSKSDIKNLQEMLNKEKVSPTGAIEMIKDLRANAKDNFRAFTDPSKVALGRAQRNAADALDTLIEDNLTAAGKPELVKEYKKSRQLIAKSYDVEASLNDATGNVNAVYLGKLLKKRPMTGELKDIARFAKTFEKSAKTPEAVGTHPGFSPLDIAVAGMEAVPALAAGRPGLAAGAVGAVAGRPLARSAGLSEYYQRRGASATRTDTAQRAKQAMARGIPAAVAGATTEEERKPISMDEAF